MNMLEIGGRIKLRREALGMNQESLGELLGLKKATISRYESGDIKSMDTETAQKFASALKCDPMWLVGWNKESDSSNRVNQDDILDKLKNDPQVRLVAKIHGDLTEDGKKDLLKYAELLRNQRDKGWDD